MILHRQEIRAIDEQLASRMGYLEPGGINRKKRTETILVEMLDMLPTGWKPQYSADSVTSKKQRRRRRGPQVLTLV